MILFEDTIEWHPAPMMLIFMMAFSYGWVEEGFLESWEKKEE